MQSFIIALQFLTRIPISFNVDWNDKNVATSVLWYPVVGGVIASLLFLIMNIISTRVDEMLSAALLLSVWVLISGGLHLDGLADSADAWVGSHGNKLRALEIMKDPAAGPIAVIMLLLVLLIKFSALYSLLKLGNGWLIFLPVIIARCVPMVLFLTTPYVREQGLGSAMANNLSKNVACGVLFFVAVFVVLILGFLNGIVLIVITLLVLAWLRYLMLKLIKGITGDTIGASIEIIEALVLCVTVFMSISYA